MSLSRKKENEIGLLNTTNNFDSSMVWASPQAMMRESAGIVNCPNCAPERFISNRWNIVCMVRSRKLERKRREISLLAVSAIFILYRVFLKQRVEKLKRSGRDAFGLNKTQADTDLG